MDHQVPTQEQDPAELAESVGRLALAAGERVAVAESLTGGLVCSLLAKAPDAGTWFAGGVVSYGSDVKHDLLGVPPGPVVSEPAAAAMAEGVARLLKVRFAVSLTGAGGPDPQDGQPPGTVFVGVLAGGEPEVSLLRLDGDPEQVCREAARRALSMLGRALASFDHSVHG
jgi:nicotinamide-nucleotide amidase